MSPVSARSVLKMCYVRLVIWWLTKGLVLERIAGEAIQKSAYVAITPTLPFQLYASSNKE